jgi:transposase
VAYIERVIEKIILEFPELEKQYSLLKSVPGIGKISAATIIVETGEITRFGKPDELSSYAGLCPKVSQSGETVHHGHISKMGPPVLRWVLQQSAWVAIREDENIRKVFNRISRKAGKKKAATAIARKLLIYGWSVCKKGTPFKWPVKEGAKAEVVKNKRVIEQDLSGWYCQL